RRPAETEAQPLERAGEQILARRPNGLEVTAIERDVVDAGNDEMVERRAAHHRIPDEEAVGAVGVHFRHDNERGDGINGDERRDAGEEQSRNVRYPRARSTWRPRADNAVSTMCAASRPAHSYWRAGDACSMKRSGRTIGRTFSPWSSMPVEARCCSTWLAKPPIAPSSIVISTSC